MARVDALARGVGKGPMTCCGTLTLTFQTAAWSTYWVPTERASRRCFAACSALRTATGSIAIDGRDLRQMSVRERARTIAHIPQTHESVYDYSVLDVVLMSAASQAGAFGVPRADQVKRAWEALERVGIARLAHRPATRISGGEQQLVLIARALAQNAHTIIMDEPTSALDYGNTMRVLGCVRQLAREGLSIIQSTHQPDQAFLFADKVLAINKGHVRAFGDPRDVITEELVAELYGVDVSICSLFGDRMRVCVPSQEIDVTGQDARSRVK